MWQLYAFGALQYAAGAVLLLHGIANGAFPTYHRILYEFVTFGEIVEMTGWVTEAATIYVYIRLQEASGLLLSWYLFGPVVAFQVLLCGILLEQS